MWLKLSNQVSPWWKHKDNDSYIYYNKGDGQVKATFYLDQSCVLQFVFVIKYAFR